MSKQQLEFCTTKLDGNILTVTINRPEVMNSLHSPANIELGEVFDDFSQDAEQWIAIITGAGDRAFSAGNDLKYQAGGGKLERAPKGFAGLTSRFDCVKPIIAAVNGVAMGGGFEIALACDIIIASDNAVFALPEPRVGLAALAGGLHRLPRQIGLKQAMGMILTGRRVGAKEGMSAKDPTIAEYMKSKGYMTAQYGRNHLGDLDEMLPTNHGFDEFFGNLYHLNAEEEPENVDYPKNPEFLKNFGPRGVIRSNVDGTIEDTWLRVAQAAATEEEKEQSTDNGNGLSRRLRRLRRFNAKKKDDYRVASYSAVALASLGSVICFL